MSFNSQLMVVIVHRLSEKFGCQSLTGTFKAFACWDFLSSLGSSPGDVFINVLEASKSILPHAYDPIPSPPVERVTHARRRASKAFVFSIFHFPFFILPFSAGRFVPSRLSFDSSNWQTPQTMALAVPRIAGENSRALGFRFSSCRVSGF